MRSTSLEASIETLKAAYGNPVLPPDLDGLRRLEEELPHIPSAVRDLYQRVGGTDTNRLCYLMSPSEVLETVGAFRTFAGGKSTYLADVAEFGDGRIALLL